jgi:hypothetical protein
MKRYVLLLVGYLYMVLVLAQDLNLGLRFCNLIGLSYDGFDLKACTTGGYHFLIDSSGQYKKG